MISFIIPVSQSRAFLLEGCIYAIKRAYAPVPHEIIVIEQDEKEPFKLGQVRNIGFIKSSGDTIVFIDVDIRLIHPINFFDLLVFYKKPFVAWDRLFNISENFLGTYTILNRVHRCGAGGCTVFTRNQFEQSGGHSNLLLGWGSEDELIARRCRAKRSHNNLYHVFHTDYSGPYGKNGSYRDHNRAIYLSDDNRYRTKDSFKQTVWDEIELKDLGSIKHYLVWDIRVPDTFEYKDLYICQP